MPRIHPDGWRRLPARGAAARRLDTLSHLARVLPEDFSVYHGVHWTRVEAGQAVFGSVDFIVVGPDGDVLLIQQVDGFLDEEEDGLIKRHLKQRKHVSTELARTAAALRTRVQQLPEAGDIALDVLLYCPDYRLRQPGTAGLDPARIVDADRREQLGRIVSALFLPAAPNPASRQAVERFFADTLELVPEVNAMVGQAHALYTRLSGGLTEWARRLDMQPFRLRVTGTAGSGKTQLALAVFGDAVTAGRRPLYVCYNRPLADHMARIAPPGGEVATYHQLCDRALRAAGRQPDFSGAGVFDRLEAGFAELAVAESERFDELIIDEGQDFRAAWLDALMRRLKPGARAWWLEDPLQNLYDRPELALEGWVRLYSDRNYRSPGDILELLNRSLTLPRPVEAGSPLTQTRVETLVWEDEQGLFEQTRRAMTRAIGLGFRREHIALITFRGRENSRFTPLTRLGPHALKSFTGRYDLLGSPEYTEGAFLIDSVYRFKGQAAPCIIFTEIDFARLDRRAMRKLFVGATRAGMKLIMVVSRPAAQALGLEQGASGGGPSPSGML